MRKTSRRNFLSTLLLNSTLLTYNLFWITGCQGYTPFLPLISKVIRVTDPGASDKSTGRDNANLNAEIVKNMVDRGVIAFTGKKSTQSAWAEIIPDPSKNVAIKVNCQITGIYTKSKVVNTVTQGLIQRGVPADNIVIYDLRDKAFQLAGFKKNVDKGIKVGTNEELGGFSYLSWFGGIPFLKPRVRFCKVLAGEGTYGCDYLINIPVLKALDNWAGVTISMKNHFGSISCPSNLHNNIHESIAALNAHKLIMNKTRLIIVDGIFTQYKWTNGRDQEFVKATNQLLFGVDSVAIDTIGWHTIEIIRESHGLTPVNPSPEYLNIAANQYGLGNNNLNRIKLIDI